MKRILALVLFLLVRIKGAPFKNNDKETLKHVVDELRNIRENYEEIASENKILKNELQEMKHEWQSFSQSRWPFWTKSFPQLTRIDNMSLRQHGLISSLTQDGFKFEYWLIAMPIGTKISTDVWKI